MAKLRAGILGATGMVGQRFIQMLQGNDMFSVEAVIASERSAGKPYAEAAKWYLAGNIPTDIAELTVQPMKAKVAKENNLDIVFSAVPSAVAREIEGDFAEKIPVYSNTATYRMDEDVPLLIAEVNPEHLGLVPAQQKRRGWEGYIVTNPNCSTIGLVIPLKPLFDSTIGIEEVITTTMQAVSGAGYDGVPSMAILDNMIPFIKNEEPKIESETLKLLGSLGPGKIDYADFPVYANCNRIAVIDGHMESVIVKTREDFEVEEVKKIFEDFTPEPQQLKLPSAPENAIVVFDDEDRPQPRRDRDLGGGMTVSVGRLDRKAEKVLRFTCLSHNTIIGAAGASILNAELAAKKDLL
ncbi:MAG: aspartate-semialdehyde dehydrogenase [Candidatus Altiarchaeota archaeon]